MITRLITWANGHVGRMPHRQYSAMPNCQSLHHLRLCIVWWQANSLCFRFDMGKSLDSIGSIGYWMYMMYLYILTNRNWSHAAAAVPWSTDAITAVVICAMPVAIASRARRSGMNSSDCGGNMQVDFRLSESYSIYYIYQIFYLYRYIILCIYIYIYIYKYYIIYMIYIYIYIYHMLYIYIYVYHMLYIYHVIYIYIYISYSVYIYIYHIISYYIYI